MTRPSHWGLLSQRDLSEIWVKSCFLCECEYCKTCRKHRFKLNLSDRYGRCKDYRIKNEYAPRIIQLKGVQPTEQVAPKIPKHWQIW